jgi:RNA 3'-terminal phosphate cyclase (ATP)
MPQIIEIDGSAGEGGGQVVRTSVALSAITGTPVRVYNVRGRRSKPGLQPQHLAAVRAAAEICQAEVRGAAVGSIDFTFTPAQGVRAGDYRFEIGTAGASTLVVQTVLVPLALAGRSRVTVTGGTHNPMAPPVEYLEFVYLPALRRMGLEASLRYERAGFYPKGGGEMTVEFAGAFEPIHLTDRGRLRRSGGVIVTSGLPNGVAERGERALREFARDLRVERRDKPSLGPGAAAFAYAEFDGGFGGYTGLGERGKPMERVAEEAGSPFEHWLASNAPVDGHLADQLVLPACFSGGRSRWRTGEVTEHLRTVLRLVTEFVPVATELEELSDGGGIVQLDADSTTIVA